MIRRIGVVSGFILQSERELQIMINNDVQAVRSAAQTHFNAIIDSDQSTNLSAVTVRRAVPEDADTCGRICYEAFTTFNHQHQFPPDFPAAEAAIGLLHMMFSHPHFYCVVAEIDGKIVGSNCLDERSIIAGVGPLSIASDAQNRSIGRMLMRAVMARAAEQGLAGLRLLQVAFHNRSLSLYAKLGFEAREPIAMMQGPPIKQSLPGWTVRPANESDLEPAARLCERVHGFNRTDELSDGILQGTAFVVERHGQMTGYASEFGFFGHAVGESNLDLQALIGAAETFSEPGILVPTRNATLFRWCLENGLRVVYSWTLMTIGLYNEPSEAYLPSVLY
jgi:ribosomal protein S18 acetylase RimI-like enzyme